MLPSQRLGMSRAFALMVLTVIAVTFASSAHALVFPTAQLFAGNNAANTGWVSAANNNGVAVSASKVVDVAAGAARVPVAVESVAAVSSARIAASAVRAIPYAGYAVVAYEVLNVLKEKGLGYGPCPAGSTTTYAFICKSQAPSIAGDAPGTGYYYNSSFKRNTTAEACTAYAENSYGASTGYPPNWYYTALVDPSYNCVIRVIAVQSGYVQGPFSYPVYRAPDFYTPALEPASSNQITDDLTISLSSGSVKNKILLDALRTADVAHPEIGVADPLVRPIRDDTPSTVTAPPVTRPATVVKTETIPNIDGTTSTRTTQETTTVTPITTGTTVGDTKITFPTVTTTTITTTNNTTNETNTTTTVDTPPTDTSPSDGPTECGSPGKPKCQIDETGTPDGKTAVDKATTDADTAVTAHIGKIPTIIGDGNKDASWGWFPQLPTVACHGYQVGEFPTIDPCPYVPQLKQIMEWAWAIVSIFLIIGMTNTAIRS